MARHAGFNGYVLITPSGGNAATLNASHWSINEKAESIDVTGFTDSLSPTGSPVTSKGIVTKYITGAVDTDINIEGSWDDTEDFFSGPPLIPPSSFARIELYPDFPNTPARVWTFTEALITSATMDVDIHGAVKYTIAAKANTTYTRV